jgi:hypothetical protein
MGYCSGIALLLLILIYRLLPAAWRIIDFLDTSIKRGL